MAVATTTALLAIGAAAAVGSASYSVYAGERGNTLQRYARRRQEAAQKEATRISLLERQRAEQQAARENRPTPTASVEGIDPAGTDLTGGAERDRLRLARTSRLGG